MQINAREAHGVGVKGDVSEGNTASPTLRGVHPIARPWIAEKIRLALIPDVKTVEGMEENGKPNTKKFQHRNQRQTRQKPNLMRVSSGSVDYGGVGDQNVLNQKRAHRHD